MRILPHTPLKLPPQGQLLVTRTPFTNFLRVTWPDGQHRTVLYDHKGDDKLIRLGLPGGERMAKMLNYVWNFNQALIAVDPEIATPPAPVGEGPRMPLPSSSHFL